MKRYVIIPFLVILCIAFLANYDVYFGIWSYKNWREMGAGKLLPDPSDVFGYDVICDIDEWNGSNYFSTDVYFITQDAFNKYVDAVIKCGFKLDFSRSDTYYSGTHLNIFRDRRVWLSLDKEKQIMSVHVYE